MKWNDARGVAFAAVSVAESINTVTAKHRERPCEWRRLENVIIRRAVPDSDKSILHGLFGFVMVSQNPQGSSQQDWSPHPVDFLQCSPIALCHTTDERHGITHAVFAHSSLWIPEWRKIGLGHGVVNGHRQSLAATRATHE